MGAMLGTAYGDLVHQRLPAIVGPAGAYGLVGMGAVFAATARAPMTAVIIIFELTGEYQIILPLMFAVALAAGVSNLLTGETIYTLKLRRRGIDIMRRRAASLMETLKVGMAMRSVPAGVPQDRPIRDVISRFAREGREALPVVDSSGRYQGSILARHVEQSLRDDALEATVGDLAQETPTLIPDQSLERAISLLVHSDASGLPVVDAEQHAVIGWLTHRDVLRLYAQHVHGAHRRPELGSSGRSGSTIA
jgi:CIC family chloride channel protein